MDFYATPNPVQNERKFLPEKRITKIQKIDDYTYHTKQLFHAVQHGYLNFLESVPEKILRSRLNVLDEKNSYSMLHYACLENHKEIVLFLLAFKPDLNIIGSNKLRPIHLASQKGHTEVVELLCKQRSVQIDVSDAKGQTALHMACKRANMKVVQTLLRYGASVKILEFDKTSVIHHPVRRNDGQMVNVLINHGAPLNIRNSNGQTPMMIAAIEGHSNLFLELLNKQQHVNNSKNNSVLSTPVINVIFPVQTPGVKVIEILNEKDNDGLSCLGHAVLNENSEIIKVCIENGADLGSKQNDGKTILHTAAISGYIMIFDLIENLSLILNTTDKGLNTPLHHAIVHNNIDMVKFLLDKGALVNICNRHFQTPIMVACIEMNRSINSLEIIKILFERKAILKIRDFEMKTVFHYLVEKEDVEMIQYFITNLEKSDLLELINLQDDSYNSALHCAAHIGNSEICNVLLNAGANPLLFSGNDSLALHIATKKGHLECVKVLLKASVETSYYRDINENSAIHLAAENGKYEIFKHLVEIGKDRPSKDQFGRNTLMFAAKSGCIQIVESLMNDQINLNMQDQMKNTALHQAAEVGHLEIVKRLWISGAKLSENIYGQTQLDVAVINKQWNVVRFFLNDENWRRVMKYRHQNGDSHMKILIKRNEEITMELLDKCITENNSNNMDPNYEIRYWFGLLDPGTDDPGSINARFFALESMSRYRRLNLLKHPVSHKLLKNKWKTFGLPLFLIDFILYQIFLVCITLYMSVNVPLLDTDMISSSTGCKSTNSSVIVNRSTAGNAYIFLNILIFFIVSFQILLLLMKFYEQKLRFFKDFWNYVFIVCYLLVFLFIKTPNQLPCLYEWQFGPGLIFVSWYSMLYYLQFFPKIGIKVMIFHKVLMTIIKVFVIFMCLFIGFGFAFYIINSSLEPFKNQGVSIIKSMGMMIGELELVSYFTTSKQNYANVSYAMISIFIIVMPTTLFNLTIGLAVGNIEQATADASLETLTLRVTYVCEVESMLPKRLQRYFYRPEEVNHTRKILRNKIVDKIFF